MTAIFEPAAPAAPMAAGGSSRPGRSRTLTAVDRGVLEALAYADVFDWPLTAAEIHRYLPVLTSLDQVRVALAPASPIAPLLERCGELAMLRGRSSLAVNRRRREDISAALWPRALRHARVVASLPFVRMVAITGSLAVGAARDGDDVDLLVVTVDGRLWLARAATMAVVRMAALDGVRLCPNYLLSESALALPERSLFAARELAQMVPVTGRDVYERLVAENAWYREFLPNAAAPTPTTAARGPIPARGSGIRRLAETVLRTPPGDRLERFEMNRKIRQLCATSASAETRYDASCCKGHADEHGRRVLAAFEARLALLSEVI